MQFTGKELTLPDLGEISDKARASWDDFQFDYFAEPGAQLVAREQLRRATRKQVADDCPLLYQRFQNEKIRETY